MQGLFDGELALREIFAYRKKVWFNAKNKMDKLSPARCKRLVGMIRNIRGKGNPMGYHRKSTCLAVMWFCLMLFPVHTMAAEDKRDMYYSVHVDSAGNIEDVNRKMNHLKVTGKIVFWEKRDVKGVGTYYKVYLGWFEAFKPARRFMRRLQEAGWKKSMTVHWFKHPPWEQKDPSEVAAQSASEDHLPPVPLQVAMVDRFVDNEDGTVTDRQTGLMWIKNGWRIEFLGAVSWEDALKKCAGFRAGNHTDWRLPTVKEWQSIVDRYSSYPALVDPNPFENIITHMPYWSRTEYTYGDKPTAVTTNSYTVMLYSGTFNHQRKTDLAFILPVRSSGR